MKQVSRSRLIALTAAALMLAGCSEESSDESPDHQSDGGTGNGGSGNQIGNDNGEGDGGGENACGDTTAYLMLDEAHNYSFSSSIQIESYPLTDYPEIPTIDWSGLDRNIMGHQVDPLQDIAYVAMIVWKLGDTETFEQWLNTDSLDMQYFNAVVEVRTEEIPEGACSAALDQFTLFGNDVDAERFFDAQGDLSAEENTFLIMVGDGEMPGAGAIMVAFIVPTDSPDAPKELKLTGDAIQLDYTADIDGADRYSVPMNTAELTVDWTEMDGKTNAMGLEWKGNQVTRIILAHYRDKSVADLESNFLDLEVMADETYSTKVQYSRPTSLEGLLTDDGIPFKGIGSSEGLWVLALQCTGYGCYNPAPKYLTVLQPCSEP